jgi:hypothetical protein
MNRRRVFKLKLPSRTLVLGQRTLLMGVLNVTPDSFSDGGNFFSLSKAVEGALAMQQAGADARNTIPHFAEFWLLQVELQSLYVLVTSMPWAR